MAAPPRAGIETVHESRKLERVLTWMMIRGLRLGGVLGVIAVGACASHPNTVVNTPLPGQNISGLQAQVALDIAAREHAAGDYAEAISYYRSVIGIHSKLREKAYVGLGDTLLDAGVVDEASDNYQLALGLSPKDPQALIGMGNAMVVLDEPVPAVADLQKGLALQPSARGYRALAIADDLLGNYTGAVTDCGDGLAEFPDDPGLRVDLGFSQALEGDFASAVATMQAIAAAPNATSRDRLNLALVLGLAGRDAEAAQAAQSDLDAKSIQSNLIYYAELRALPAGARARALLRPGSLIAPTPPATTAPEPAPQAADTPVVPAPVAATAPNVEVADYPLPAPSAAATGPVVEAPVAQAPVVQAPAVQAPVVEAPVAQAPAFQAPVAQAPVVQAPVAQAPVVQTPVAQEPVAPPAVAVNSVAPPPTVQDSAAAPTAAPAAVDQQPAVAQTSAPAPQPVLAGPVTVTGGTLDLGTTTQTASAVTLSGGTIQNGEIDSPRFDLQAGTVSAVLGGAGALTKTGPGTVTLLKSSRIAGGTTVSGGTLDLGSTTQATSALTLTGGTIQNGEVDAPAYDLQSGTVSAVLGGSGTLTKSGPGTVTLLKSNTITGGTTVSDGTLDLGATTQNTSALTLNGGTIQNGDVVAPTFDVQAGRISAVLSGSGALVKSGSGTVILSNNNTYTGGTTVTAGTLALAPGGTLGLSSGQPGARAYAPADPVARAPAAVRHWHWRVRRRHLVTSACHEVCSAH